MREISPAYNMTADEYMARASSKQQELIESVRQRKRASLHLLPSSNLIDESKVLTPELRVMLVDKVALLVDENIFGRAEMCEQFSLLLAFSLNKLGFQAKAVVGTADYFVNQKKVFSWWHSWVRVGDEIIDANVDIIHENPYVPKVVVVRPYWGLAASVPQDRRLHQDHSSKANPDDYDVNQVWLPELEIWLENTASPFLQTST